MTINVKFPEGPWNGLREVGVAAWLESCVWNTRGRFMTVMNRGDRRGAILTTTCVGPDAIKHE